MRRSRRNGHGGLEFGGSGEDSFVAVVVTKLTGALLFILLLTMVIMALLPKGIDHPPAEGDRSPADAPPLTIATPETLPEAIVGRPYVVALAATGGRGPLTWTLEGPLPEGLTFDPAEGRLQGMPGKGTPQPLALTVRVSDGTTTARRATQLVVYQSDRPLTTPAWWKPGLPPVPWRDWLDHGFGFLLLWLVHLVGMNTVGGLERRNRSAPDAIEPRVGGLRFALYRAVVRLGTVSATAGLALWLWQNHA